VAGVASGGVALGATPVLAIGGAALGSVVGGVLGGAVYDLSQTLGELGNQLPDSLLLAKKHDISEVDAIIRRLGLDREQRRRLHDILQREKAGRRTVPKEEIEEIAREIVEEAAKKNNCE
jgi:hypothetical protein